MESFRFIATVGDRSAGLSTAPTLRYYGSSDTTISTSDTQVGTDAVSARTAAGTSDESIGLPAPSTAGTYCYGAFVGPVSGDSDTGNDCSSAVAVVDGGPLPLFDLHMSRSVLHSPVLGQIGHETDDGRVTMFKCSGTTTAPIAALVPASLAVGARTQTEGSVYRLTLTIDGAPASCSNDDIVRISKTEGLFDGFTKSLPQSTPHRNAERSEPMNSISKSRPDAEPSVPDRSGQHALRSPNQFLVRFAFRATALAMICGFPADIVATDPMTKSFTGSPRRNDLVRVFPQGWLGPGAAA